MKPKVENLILENSGQAASLANGSNDRLSEHVYAHYTVSPNGCVSDQLIIPSEAIKPESSNEFPKCPSPQRCTSVLCLHDLNVLSFFLPIILLSYSTIFVYLTVTDYEAD